MPSLLNCYTSYVGGASSGERFPCLDMICVTWESGRGEPSSDCAILVEIWSSGALLHTEAAIPADAVVSMAAPSGPVSAKVDSCMPEDYGFLVEVRIDSSERWFPHFYQPSHLLGSSAP
jgi:hypothetical protein